MGIKSMGSQCKCWVLVSPRLKLKAKISTGTNCALNSAPPWSWTTVLVKFQSTVTVLFTPGDEEEEFQNTDINILPDQPRTPYLKYVLLLDGLHVLLYAVTVKVRSQTRPCLYFPPTFQSKAPVFVQSSASALWSTWTARPQNRTPPICVSALYWQGFPLCYFYVIREVIQSCESKISRKLGEVPNTRRGEEGMKEEVSTIENWWMNEPTQWGWNISFHFWYAVSINSSSLKWEQVIGIPEHAPLPSLQRGV